MSDAELDAKLQHSYAQAIAGEDRSMSEVFDDSERNFESVAPVEREETASSFV